MTQLQALQASTIKPAELLKWQANVGEIKPGLYADIIAVDSNPLTDISTVESVSFVMKGGVIYKQ